MGWPKQAKQAGLYEILCRPYRSRTEKKPFSRRLTHTLLGASHTSPRELTISWSLRGVDA